MDLDPIQLFVGNTHDPASASSCGFTSQNEKKVTEYLDNLKKYLKDHKVVERMDRLHASLGKALNGDSMGSTMTSRMECCQQSEK